MWLFQTTPAGLSDNPLNSKTLSRGTVRSVGAEEINCFFIETDNFWCCSLKTIHVAYVAIIFKLE